VNVEIKETNGQKQLREMKAQLATMKEEAEKVNTPDTYA